MTGSKFRNTILGAACVGSLLLAGCATRQAPLPAAPFDASCLEQSRQLEALARRHDVYISEPRAVDGLPLLASNRLLASFQPALLSSEQRQDWLQRLLAAGTARRQLLRAALRGVVGSAAAPGGSEEDVTALCSGSAADATAFSDSDWAALSTAAAIDDDYLTSRRVLGLYPLTALPVKLGVTALQREIHETFDRPLEQLPVQGSLQRFAPEAGETSGKTPRSALRTPATLASDSLGLRLYGSDRSVLAAKFAEHAPLLEIDVRGDYDRPGAPFIGRRGVPRVQSDHPLAYRYASLVQFAGSLRLQLNYVFWFDERPPMSPLDTLAGALDSLVWRVTLDESGDVLLYDSIHSCGCYQQFFPSPALELRREAKDWLEPPLIPQRAPKLAAGQQLVLRVASGTHYLQRLHVDDAKGVGDAADSGSLPTQRYSLRPYAELYTLAGEPASARLPEGREGASREVRGLFNQYGLVPGTQRGERFYLWPMGIRSPGGMRERGRQPTAFLGRRHFDDADLLDRIFSVSP